MRPIVRLSVLALAALGAKWIWERCAPLTGRPVTKGQVGNVRFGRDLRRTGPEVTGLAARIGHAAATDESDDDYSPLQKVEEVTAAFEAESAYGRALSDG